MKIKSEHIKGKKVYKKSEQIHTFSRLFTNLKISPVVINIHNRRYLLFFVGDLKINSPYVTYNFLIDLPIK